MDFKLDFVTVSICSQFTPSSSLSASASLRKLLGAFSGELYLSQSYANVGELMK